MTKVLAETLKPGDVIMPPPREIQLWMRRVCTERGLPESALQLTITEIHEGASDKRGRWLVVSASQTSEWLADSTRTFPFSFKVRPATPWVKVS